MLYHSTELSVRKMLLCNGCMKDLTDKEEKGVKVNYFMSLFAVYCFVYASGNVNAKCFAMLRDMFILWNCPRMKQ